MRSRPGPYDSICTSWYPVHYRYLFVSGSASLWSALSARSWPWLDSSVLPRHLDFKVQSNGVPNGQKTKTKLLPVKRSEIRKLKEVFKGSHFQVDQVFHLENEQNHRIQSVACALWIELEQSENLVFEGFKRRKAVVCECWSGLDFLTVLCGFVQGSDGHPIIAKSPTWSWPRYWFPVSCYKDLGNFLVFKNSH